MHQAVSHGQSFAFRWKVLSRITDVHHSLVLWLRQYRPIFRHFRDGFFFFLRALLSPACMKSWSLPLAGYLPSLKSQHPYVPSVILFSEWQQLPLTGRSELTAARHTQGEKEVCHKLEGGGSPTFEQLHPLHSIPFTLKLSSRAQLPEQFQAVKEFRLPVVTGHLCFDVAMEVCVTRGERRSGLRLVARAASAAEAGVVFVTAELGLQDQVTVGKVWLVHALSAQVHDMIHSSCSQAKGEAAVNTLPGLILRFCFPPKGHGSFLLSPSCQI